MKPQPSETAAAAIDADFAEAHRRLLDDSTIQFELTRFEPRQRPAWLEAVGDVLAAIYPALEVALWVALAAGALYLLYLLALRLAGREWRRPRIAEEAHWRPAEGPARQLLGEADTLAARGLFSEAARLLLFRSIEDIEARRPTLVRPALTSRDIAALPEIPQAPRAAFRRIARGVEHSLFGGRALDAEGWRICRSAYEEFAFAEGWRG